MNDELPLRDPDREREELGNPVNEPVQANRKKEALEKCQRLALQYERRLVSVKAEGQKWFRCYFE